MTRKKVFEGLVKSFADLYNTPEIKGSLELDHIEDTPTRTAKALMELFGGCFDEPEIYLTKRFNNKKYDEMIYVNDISFVSMCAHHTLPFMGKIHFAYTPNESIVGLSKIPRFIECLAHRPQVQESLTPEIADIFMREVKPWGCGVVIEAVHSCMMIRGIKQRSAYMKTTALRQSFTAEPTRSEFLNGIRRTTERIWP